MEILYLTRLFKPFTGGAATEYDFYFKNLIKMKKINSIDILSCRNNAKPAVESFNANYTYRSIIDFHKYNQKLKKILFFILSFLSSLFTYLNFYIIKGKKYDIIQIHSDFLFLKGGKYLNYSIYIFKFLAKRSVLDIKDLSSYPKKDIGFDNYLVNSLNTYNCIKKFIPKEKISLIYSPLIIKNLKSIKPIYGNILYLGSISKQKGINELLSAMTLIIDDYPEVILNLYGEEFFKFNYKKNTRYHGPVSHGRALRLIKKCEILVLPSFSESLPRVALEAMYLKKKILISRCAPELNEILNNKFLIKNINKNEIANKLINLLKLKKKSAYNYDFNRHKDKIIIQQFYSLYENLLN